MEVAESVLRKRASEGIVIRTKTELQDKWGASTWSDTALECMYRGLSRSEPEADSAYEKSSCQRGWGSSHSYPFLPAPRDIFGGTRSSVRGDPQVKDDWLLASPVRDVGTALARSREQKQQHPESEDDNEAAQQLRSQLLQLRAEGHRRAARLRRERQLLQQQLAEARQQQQVLLLRQQQRSICTSVGASQGSCDPWGPPTLSVPPTAPAGVRRGPRGSPLPPFSPRMVLLHVYDLTPAISNYVNRIMRPLGAGAFHAGVEVYGQEYSFGQTAATAGSLRHYGSERASLEPWTLWTAAATLRGAAAVLVILHTDETTGVSVCQPMQHPAHVYRETVPMGPADLDMEEFLSLVEVLKVEWPGNSYDVLSRNCVNFADHLCVLLGVGHVPPWLFRLQRQANSIKGGARAAAAAAAAAARQLQRLNTQARISATAMAAAEAAATAAAVAAGAAVSFGRFIKHAHQEVRLSEEMGRLLVEGMSFLSERFSEGVSCIPSEWNEEEITALEPLHLFDRAPTPPEGLIAESRGATSEGSAEKLSESPVEKPLEKQGVERLEELRANTLVDPGEGTPRALRGATEESLQGAAILKSWPQGSLSSPSQDKEQQRKSPSDWPYTADAILP
ncbi:hypothetical protein, conserved [Eimeria necatrix]|uniref:PPPDE domain-containing protein n=1 Tax=Eimeria necatrix TaxID=51315 RepID=U6MGH0_9EIME|nr:hypothetical protein, conserved [Eimeria necatrix]CDJ63111.1 hypothetical protein, conserved [Eimeria necatrix]